MRSEILEGVLPCDYIGFHTYDYARHFLSACNRVLNLPTMPNAVQYKGRTVNVGTIPIGIDPEKFTDVTPPSRAAVSLPTLPLLAFVFVFLRDANPSNCKNRNVKPALRNWKRNSRGKKLLLEWIDWIISREFHRNYSPSKCSSLNIPNGSEKYLTLVPVSSTSPL